VLPLAGHAASFFAQTVIAGIAFPLLCHVGFPADDRAGLHVASFDVGIFWGRQPRAAPGD
jgi:hypothetical protein